MIVMVDLREHAQGSIYYVGQSCSRDEFWLMPVCKCDHIPLENEA